MLTTYKLLAHSNRFIIAANLLNSTKLVKTIYKHIALVKKNDFSAISFQLFAQTLPNLTVKRITHSIIKNIEYFEYRV
jgi:hypothetical protein